MYKCNGKKNKSWVEKFSLPSVVRVLRLTPSPTRMACVSAHTQGSAPIGMWVGGVAGLSWRKEGTRRKREAKG